ncbi:MAG: YHYH protein [Flavobacteriaceae bacterium]|nr:YHYH protein [Flavobacteriaceae bacterium]
MILRSSTLLNSRIYLLFLILFMGGVKLSFAQPELSSWILNPGTAKGYAGILSNVQKVQYSDNFIYITAACIPGYDIGPWKGNPNTPANQNFQFKITRKPVVNLGNPTAIGGGHIGVFSNGVSIFNASDAQSYLNQKVWNRNAYYWEGPSFDTCLGHPAPNGEYHHHVSPKCLYNHNDTIHHSPIIGYAFDGFPIYGACAYAKTNGQGAIRLMRSSFKLKSMVTRTNGPAIDPSYPLGCYMEDYEFVDGSGDLDKRNGRFCITPDYPNGIYCYFATLDEKHIPSFPYVPYTSYYGVVTAGNMGPGSGHNSPTETVITYTGSTSVIEKPNETVLHIWPNPSSTGWVIGGLSAKTHSRVFCTINNAQGQKVYHIDIAFDPLNPTIHIPVLQVGIYWIEVCDEKDLVFRSRIVAD